MPKPTSRDVVFRVLSRWTRPNDPPFLPERTDPDWASLSPRDRPFAYDLLTGILRWRNTLDTIIASRLKQPIDTLDLGIRVALWLGAYQLLFQGTADYAAVDTAVTLARRVNPKAAGLVNAVLRSITRLEPRRVASEGPSRRLARHVLALDFETDLRFNAALFPDPVKAPAAHLAAVRSHPKSFVEHLLKIHPMQAGDILLRNNQRPLVTLRADVDQMDVPAAAELAVHGEVPRFLVALEGWSEGLERLVESGQLSPQDPTSAKPIRNLAAMAAQGNLPHFTPRQILDYCAGLGTKTIQLARTFPEAKITATDLANEKLSRLHARVQRLKLANVKTCPLTEIEKGFDLIVVDVPCSNTGVFAKRVQSRWRWPALDHAALGALQLQLLQQAAAVLGPQGLLLYSTCSIDPAENQERVRSFLAQSPAFHVVAEEFTLPSLAAPPNAPHDGGYFALLQRR